MPNNRQREFSSGSADFGFEFTVEICSQYFQDCRTEGLLQVMHPESPPFSLIPKLIIAPVWGKRAPRQISRETSLPLQFGSAVVSRLHHSVGKIYVFFARGIFAFVVIQVLAFSPAERECFIVSAFPRVDHWDRRHAMIAAWRMTFAKVYIGAARASV